MGERFLRWWSFVSRDRFRCLSLWSSSSELGEAILRLALSLLSLLLASRVRRLSLLGERCFLTRSLSACFTWRCCAAGDRRRLPPSYSELGDRQGVAPHTASSDPSRDLRGLWGSGLNPRRGPHRFPLDPLDDLDQLLPEDVRWRRLCSHFSWAEVSCFFPRTLIKGTAFTEWRA